MPYGIDMLVFCLKNRQESEDVRVTCNVCSQPAVISSRVQLTVDVADLYCSCKDPECGHTFVAKLSFSHTLSPSAKDSDRMLVELLKGKTQQEQQALFDMANA